jgi:hypothetical protein
MMGAVEPPATPSPEDRPKSSFENYEIPVPAQPAKPRRPAVVGTAAIVLFVAGAMNLLTAFFFDQTGLAVALFAMVGLAQVATAVLLVLMSPIARPAGFAMGALGVVMGLVQAIEAPTAGIMSMALSAFVIYAVAAAGPSFRRG